CYTRPTQYDFYFHFHFSCLHFLYSYLLFLYLFFFLMIRRPPSSTLFPTRRSSDLYRFVRATLVVQCGTSFPNGTIWCNAVNGARDRKSTRLNSSHVAISYAVFCSKKKNKLTARRASDSPEQP